MVILLQNQYINLGILLLYEKALVVFSDFFFFLTLSCIATSSDNINSNEDFRKYLFENIKILNDKNASDYEKVSAIRNWASRNIPVCLSKNALSNSCLGWAKGNIDNIYKTFNDINRYEGGFLCGGTALMLSKIYNMLGYQSVAYNYGFEPTATHVVTLVKIKHNKTLIWSVQDAFTNSSIEYKTEPVDFKQLIYLLEKKALNHISIHSRSPKKILLTYQVMHGLENCKVSKAQNAFFKNRKLYCYIWNADTHLRKWRYETLTFVRQKHKSDNLMYAFLHPVQGHYPQLDY